MNLLRISLEMTILLGFTAFNFDENCVFELHFNEVYLMFAVRNELHLFLEVTAWALVN